MKNTFDNCGYESPIVRIENLTLQSMILEFSSLSEPSGTDSGEIQKLF